MDSDDEDTTGTDRPRRFARRTCVLDIKKHPSGRLRPVKSEIHLSSHQYFMARRLVAMPPQ
jgi:hypothetical protein